MSFFDVRMESYVSTIYSLAAESTEDDAVRTLIFRTVSITLTSLRELELEYGGLRYSAIISTHSNR